MEICHLKAGLFLWLFAT